MDKSSSPNSSRRSSPSSYRDDSSDIDELEHRSRKLTKVLRKNIDRADKRKSVLDVVRDKAWLLEDQVKLLERQTATIRSSLNRQSNRRKLIGITAIVLSLTLTCIWLGNKLLSRINEWIEP